MSKVVAIIGGGPTGFAAARALLHEPSQYLIRVFERQTKPGGVWAYTGKGPMYQGLDTNIYKELMEFKDKPFRDDLPRFLDRFDVLQYVEQYSNEIANHKSVDVSWGTTVTELSKQGNKWLLQHDNGNNKSSTVADYVIVASGHYEYPYYPEIPGLAEFAANKPSSITHTRHYVSAESYRDRKVLVVGNGSSGVDITIQLLSVTAPVTVSRHHEAQSDKVFEENTDVNWKPEATNISSDGVVTFSDGSSDVFDVILFATGYLYKLPFLETPASGEVGEDVVDPKAARVQNLHKFTFYINDPSLAFVGLNKQIVPMPFAESQAAVISRVFSGRLELPSKEKMLEEEKKLIDSKGTGGDYFTMGYPADVEFMHSLNDWAESAGPEGFLAERWGDAKAEMRSEIGKKKLGEYKRKRDESVEQRKRT